MARRAKRLVRDAISIAEDRGLVLRIVYKKGSEPEQTRDIEIYDEKNGYIRAYCRLKNAPRTFLIDRIQSASVLDIKIPSRRQPREDWYGDMQQVRAKRAAEYRAAGFTRREPARSSGALRQSGRISRNPQPRREYQAKPAGCAIVGVSVVLFILISCGILWP